MSYIVSHSHIINFYNINIKLKAQHLYVWKCVQFYAVPGTPGAGDPIIRGVQLLAGWLMTKAIRLAPRRKACLDCYSTLNRRELAEWNIPGRAAAETASWWSFQLSDQLSGVKPFVNQIVTLFCGRICNTFRLHADAL